MKTATTQRFYPIGIYTSQVTDKFCAVELDAAGVQILKAPDILRGYIPTRVTGLLVFSGKGIPRAAFDRHETCWRAVISRAMPLEALQTLEKAWGSNRTLLVSRLAPPIATWLRLVARVASGRLIFANCPNQVRMPARLSE